MQQEKLRKSNCCTCSFLKGQGKLRPNWLYLWDSLGHLLGLPHLKPKGALGQESDCRNEVCEKFDQHPCQLIPLNWMIYASSIFFSTNVHPHLELPDVMCVRLLQSSGAVRGEFSLTWIISNLVIITIHSLRKKDRVSFQRAFPQFVNVQWWRWHLIRCVPPPQSSPDVRYGERPFGRSPNKQIEE